MKFIIQMEFEKSPRAFLPNFSDMLYQNGSGSLRKILQKNLFILTNVSLKGMLFLTNMFSNK